MKLYLILYLQMSARDIYDTKARVDFIADKYRHLFSIPKKEFRKFFKGFSLTQLKGSIKQQHVKAVKNTFKERSFYETLIKKSHTKRLNNIDTLRELPFYGELTIVRTRTVFKENAPS